MTRATLRFNTVLLAALFTASFAFGSNANVLKSARNDVSQPLGSMAVNATPNGHDNEAPEARAVGSYSNPKADPVAATLAGPLNGVTAINNFEGQSAADNRKALGFAYVPSDTNGAVGATQYVQMVNVTVAVYSKSGNVLMPATPIHALWSGFGGPCEFAGDGGDPIVLYDHLANRWLISQLQYNSTFTANEQCVAISTTSDATGTYNRYEFDFGANFPDYPKFGIWPDGYYNSVNVYPAKGFAGAEACAFDRTAMLKGNAATAICFQQPSSVASLLPSDLDGSNLPPKGSPNYYVGLADTSHLNLFQFHADFNNPANSTFTGTTIPVANFTEICARAVSVSCVPEPSPGENLDGLGDRVMFRLAYRNFGDHETLLVNHTIKGGALAGVRWYEIRNPGGAASVYQQSTIVDPSTNYWMGSIAMDKLGNIGLGFSASSNHVFPSVYLAGRAAGDPLGSMSGPMVLVNGSGVQQQSYHRWGDYSAMTVDPTDDCTFWYTQEYYSSTGSFNWTTRIGSFKFDSCTSGK